MRTQGISLKRAISILARSLGTPRIESIPTARSIGRILAEDIDAKKDFPEFAICEVDGICFDGKGLRNHGSLHLSYHIKPPGNPALRLKPGQCAWISTGCFMPQNADVVVPIEKIRMSNRTIFVQDLPPAGEYIKRKGGVFKKGDVLLQRGRLIGAVERCLISIAGHRHLRVVSKPRIAIINTGDELLSRSRGVSLLADSNSELLRYCFERIGCEIVKSQLTGDEPGRIIRTLVDLPDSDLIVVTGGTGFGPNDWVRGLVGQLKADIKIGGLNCIPGRRVVFAKTGGKNLLFLPGKPGGCLILFYILIRPAIAKALGCDELELPRRKAILEHTVRDQDDCPRWYFGRVKGGKVEVKVKRSGLDFLTMGTSNCLVYIPMGKNKIKGGTAVCIVDLAF